MEEIKNFGRLDPMGRRNRFNIDHGVRMIIYLSRERKKFDRFGIILAWSTGFLRTDVLVILHAGCLTFHTIHPNKQMNNGTKVRQAVAHTEKI